MAVITSADLLLPGQAAGAAGVLAFSGGRRGGTACVHGDSRRTEDCSGLEFFPPSGGFCLLSAATLTRAGLSGWSEAVAGTRGVEPPTEDGRRDVTQRSAARGRFAIVGGRS